MSGKSFIIFQPLIWMSPDFSWWPKMMFAPLHVFADVTLLFIDRLGAVTPEILST